MAPTPQQLLKQVFGYDTFKPLQRQVIDNVLARRDSLVIMPTGGGKSLCYQIPALIFPGLTVVVSPLIALMKDQVEQLQAVGVAARFLNSSLSAEEYAANMTLVRQGKIKLLYVAPETLLTPRLFALLNSVQLDCLTIDEAHCISEWGHDFRPEYRQLVEVRQRFPDAVCLALTATATPRVRQDIQDSLGFDAANQFIASFNRENLLIEVTPKQDPLSQTLELIQRFPDQAGIIYCFSRQGVDDLARTLQARGISALPYHAGLSDQDRRQNQEMFVRDDIQIIVATIAFGMGINKPNVRFILHFDLPKSVESYYQEIGRAGRDGLSAHCRLLYSYGDIQKLKYFIEQKEGQERDVAYAQLQALVRFAEHDACRRVPLLSYFGERFTTQDCGSCDNCLRGEQQRVDITLPSQKFLSCVKRTGERFGLVHIVDVLLGSTNQKVMSNRHHELSTYGIGKDLTRDQWMHLGRQLVQKGLLDQDERFGSLRLTPDAYQALRSRETILGVLQQEQAKPAKKHKTGVEYDHALFEQLRARRKELADAEGVPPYVIFSDRSLVEMAAYYPQNQRSMLNINGVGQVKLARYGDTFLDIIQAYCQEHELQEKPRSSVPPAGQMELKTPRYVEVSQEYNAGASLEALMQRYQVQRATILDHLSKYVQDSGTLRPSQEFWDACDLPDETKAAALEAFAELGTSVLKPVFERLNGAADYEALKLLRLHYASQNGAK
jgi:ATP-dependent DNA helicase RecQ